MTTPPTLREVAKKSAGDSFRIVSTPIANAALGVDNALQGNYVDAGLNGLAVFGGVGVIKSAVGSVGKVGQVAEVGSIEGAGTVSTNISAEMESKILYGERTNGNKLIGGHSSEISNSNPNYAVEVISTNPDGTKVVKFTTQYEDGNLAKIKTSTLFPES